jgi:NifB/MoaA-like Fe-S oxidoreductase
MEYQPDLKRITGNGGQITAIDPRGPAAQLGLQIGDSLVAINGQRLRDVIDYRYGCAEEQLELLVRRADGSEQLFELANPAGDELGVEFSEPLFDRLRTCNNKCPFCFLTQMPKGFRKTLYLKDDDYRLSFLYGNFVTFTNLSDEDWQRIETQRLSPMHISVHATDAYWRSIMLGKQDLPDVVDQIRRLGELGIEVHTQVVACPGLNDGDVLRDTIETLMALHPIVESISVVPVGLTKQRFNGKAPSSVRAAIRVHENEDWIDTNWERQPLWQDPLPLTPNTAAPTPLHDPELGFCSRLGAVTDVPLRCFTGAEAAALIALVEPYRQRARETLGISLVHASDEFYLLAEQTVPPADTYDGMPQYSNGVGMVRDFLDGWSRARRRLPERLAQSTRLAIVCGTLAAPLFAPLVRRFNRIENLEVVVVPVVNEFFGEMVTVSGLLTAGDVIPALRASGCDRALLPRVMFDHAGERTIDDYSPARIAEAAGMPIAQAGEPIDVVRYIRALAQQG